MAASLCTKGNFRGFCGGAFTLSLSTLHASGDDEVAANRRRLLRATGVFLGLFLSNQERRSRSLQLHISTDPEKPNRQLMSWHLKAPPLKAIVMMISVHIQSASARPRACQKT